MANPTENIYSLNNYEIESIDSIRITIVNTEWNPDIIAQLTTSCLDTLADLGIDKSHVDTITVPGSFELPLGAKYVLDSKDKPDAVICLGCVIQGETRHFDFICSAVANGLTEVGLKYDKPVIFGVLTPDTYQQALDRAGGKHGNKGDEAAITAIKMLS